MSDAVLKNDALYGLATGKKLERSQDILTPEVIVDFLHELWQSTIAMDPCASRDPRSVVFAANRIYDTGGLDVDWPDRTYVNPPFKHLKVWMHYAVEQAHYNDIRIAMLAPTRGHRTWWHDCRDTAGCVLELKPLRFIGYPGAFPAPLSLLLWNVRATDHVGTAIEKSGLGVTKVTWL